MPTPDQIESKHAMRIKKSLRGRTIKDVRYMTAAEAQSFDWFCRPIVLVLDNGDQLVPQRDDEGNDGGALYISRPKPGQDEVVGVMRG